MTTKFTLNVENTVVVVVVVGAVDAVVEEVVVVGAVDTVVEVVVVIGAVVISVVEAIVELFFIWKINSNNHLVNHFK